MNEAFRNRWQRRAFRFCGAVLAIVFCVALSACFRPTPTEHISYDPAGNLTLVECQGQTWPEFFQIVRRESGFQIRVPWMPSGTVSMRLEMLDSWERVLELTADTKGLTVVHDSETSFSLNPK